MFQKYALSNMWNNFCFNLNKENGIMKTKICLMKKNRNGISLKN